VRFIIKPDDDTLEMLLQTENYKRLWKQNSRKILKAFRVITGLDFQQKVISARIFNGGQSTAGSFHYAMKLRALVNETASDSKLILLVHELSHRLLGGNGLGVVNLGLIADREESDSDKGNEMEHRHTYLFEYDVVKLALGEEMAEACIKFEEKEGDDINDGSHQRAWKWAMGMTFEERQRAIKMLTTKAVLRDKWADFEDKEIVRADPTTWFKGLISGQS